jgi:hypothetical protein
MIEYARNLNKKLKDLSPWDFVAKYYPDYDHANEIAWEGDLQKLLDNEFEEDDAAHHTLMNEYGGDINNPRIKADHDEMMIEIYQRAIEGYLESLSKEKE